MISNSVLDSLCLERIHKILSVKFDVELSRIQLLALIEKQPEELKKALLAGQTDPETLNIFIESVSKKITGVSYPSQQSTSYYKEYFKKKLKENKDSYFEA